MKLGWWLIILGLPPSPGDTVSSAKGKLSTAILSYLHCYVMFLSGKPNEQDHIRYQWYIIRNYKNHNTGNKLTIVPVDLNQATRMNVNIKVDVMHLGVQHACSEFSPHPEYHKLNQSCGWALLSYILKMQAIKLAVQETFNQTVSWCSGSYWVV